MDVTTILTENITVGFVIGFLIGILVKIASKAIRNLILQLIIIKWLEARNILIVDWHRLTNGLIGQQELVLNQTTDMFESLIEMGVFGGALLGGFMLANALAKNKKSWRA